MSCFHQLGIQHRELYSITVFNIFRSSGSDQMQKCRKVCFKQLEVVRLLQINRLLYLASCGLHYLHTVSKLFVLQQRTLRHQVQLNNSIPLSRKNGSQSKHEIKLLPKSCFMFFN
uniref:Uncharacterized protein n=1 Tax=Micrurus carvalhoi TaxID=3147026 RepID=A0A2H6NG37_9SAUR